MMRLQRCVAGSDTRSLIAACYCSGMMHLQRAVANSDMRPYECCLTLQSDAVAWCICRDLWLTAAAVMLLP